MNKEERIYHYIIDECIQPAESEMAPLITAWKEYEEIYDCVPKYTQKPKPWKNASNLFIPATRIAVDTVVATMVNSILSQDRIAVAEPYSGNSAEVAEQAHRITDFLHYAINEEIADFKQNLAHWIWSAAVYGTGIVKTTWLVKRRKAGRYMERTVVDLETGMVTTKREPEWFWETYYDAPYMAVVSPENFIIPLSSPSIEDAPFVAEKIFLPWSVLKQRQREGWYSNVPLTPEEYRPGELEMAQDGRQNASQLNAFQRGIFIYDFWGLVDLEGDGEMVEAHVVLTKEQNAILRIEPLPFFHGKRPYDVYRMKSKPNRFHGIGLCQIGKDLQEEINTIHNMRMDNANLAINKVYLARSGALIRKKPEELKIYPGAVIPVTTPDDIKVLAQGDVNYSSVNEESIVQAYFDKVMGVTDLAQGYIPATARRAAASTIMSVMAEGNKKIEERLKYFHIPFSEVLDKIQSLYYQYMDRNRPYSIEGVKEIQQISPDELSLKCRFNIRGLSVSNSPDVRRQNMIQAFAILSKNELISRDPKVMAMLTRELIRVLELPFRPEDLLSDETIARLEQAQAQAQAMETSRPKESGQSPQTNLLRRLFGQVTGGQGSMMGGMSSGAGLNTGNTGPAQALTLSGGLGGTPEGSGG